MFSKQTVFVIGAGASYECGLPLGIELVQRIAKSLDPATPHGEKLLPFLFDQFGSTERSDFERAAEDLRAALKSSPSTDDALNWLSSDPFAVKLGKTAIVKEILLAERNSVLYNSKSPAEFAKLDDTWLHHFFSMAKRDSRREDVGKIFKNTKIINFNYDRTIEQYLFLAFQQRGPLAAAEAASVVKSLDIIRPYGYLGSPWESKDLPYGRVEETNPLKMSDNILTLAEQRSEEVDHQIKQAISDAKVIVFLGFGFHRQNVEALTIDGKETERHIFGTTFKIDNQIGGNVADLIRIAVKSPPGSVRFYQYKAAQYLQTYELLILNSAG